MRAVHIGLLVAALACVAAPASADLKVFACEPEWGSLVRALAGEHAAVYVATTARQDPHHIEARPSLIARARSADLRSEEHTSALQSLMRISYAVFCLKKKKQNNKTQ